MSTQELVAQVETSFRKVTQEKVTSGDAAKWHIYMELVIGGAEFKTHFTSNKPIRRLDRVKRLAAYEKAVRELLAR